MELDELNQQISHQIHDAIRDWDNNRPRTQQSQQRRLGPSDLGACREFIRATIAGDRRTPSDKLNWAAFIGTAVGNQVETAATAQLGATTQRRVTTTLPSGITVTGSCDIVLAPNKLIDIKMKNGLETVMMDGPSRSNKIQVACYLTGLIQDGTLSADATASLAYLDRSGVQAFPYVWTMTAEQAASWIDVADERLADVQQALATGQSQGHLRDEDEGWCYYTRCFYRDACWPGDDFNPPDHITEPKLVDALRRYDLGRELEKAAKQIKEEAKDDLGGNTDQPRRGQTDDYTIDWTLYEARNGIVYNRINQRIKRGRKLEKPYVEVADVLRHLRQTDNDRK